MTPATTKSERLVSPAGENEIELTLGRTASFAKRLDPKYEASERSGAVQRIMSLRSAR